MRSSALIKDTLKSIAVGIGVSAATPLAVSYIAKAFTKLAEMAKPKPKVKPTPAYEDLKDAKVKR